MSPFIKISYETAFYLMKNLNQEISGSLDTFKTLISLCLIYTLVQISHESLSYGFNFLKI